MKNITIIQIILLIFFESKFFNNLYQNIFIKIFIKLIYIFSI